MKKLSLSDGSVQSEIRQVTLLYVKCCQTATTSADFQVGINALDAHWEAVRRKPFARWIRFYVMSWKADLLLKQGKLAESLAINLSSLSASASPLARIGALNRCARLLRNLG